MVLSCFCFLPPGGWYCLRPLCRHPGGREWVLSLWWAVLCKGVCSAGSCVLRKTLSSLSADARAVFLLCWLFDLRHPSTGVYRLLGRVRSWLENGSPQEGSHQCVVPKIPLPVSLSLERATAILSPQEIHKFQQVWPRLLRGYSRGSSSHCQTPRLGNLMWTQNFIPMGELLWYNYIPVCGVTHNTGFGVWFLSWLCPSCHLVVASSLDVEYLFW